MKSRPSSDVLILSRTKRLPKGVSLTDFSDKLRSCLPANLRAQFNDRVNVMTAHASKGRQANIVIILRAVTGSFPLIHPDGELFRIFGTTAADELLDERRLFYVACTRAKNNLVLLTEKGEESDFILEKNGSNQ